MTIDLIRANHDKRGDPIGVINMQDETSIANRSQYLTVAQLARQLQISESTIYGWVERNYIPYLMAGDLLRFDQDVINSWMVDEANRKREKKGQLSARVVK